ncbi:MULTISPECIES: protein kinase family protein [Clostridium]|uniref:Spore coat protein n=1 Tax=Clostridium cadaveris TaxID=1529 RepID=A0A1I2LEE6_9CLOT|nr:hypothetical protein [Clostridium cadaveris]MDU4951358.1 hypothetical protein [Clostridium sp.]MDM8312205.1 hypothetical protein [Clostridium cadaveris]NME65175.1 hypothetical protein [Clostridium cadaveris]NWK10941.1 hypothetical protein [Clostridium cadaveris]UFH64329.1 hypothetical protein KQH81_13570 [Clostridium cadaveris]
MEEKYEKFREYMNEKNIIVDSSININENITEERLSEYIESLSEFHKNAMGYEDFIDDVIPNTIGRQVEQCRTSLRKTQRYLIRLNGKEKKNKVDDMLMKDGFNILKNSEADFKDIYRSNIMKLIRRSMNRKEVIIGYFAPYNVMKQNSSIMVSTLNRCSYDLVEIDYVKMLIKLKKYRRDLLTEDLIKRCIEAEGLNEDSYNFIKTMVEFPYDFIRNFNRYRENRKLWTLDEYYNRIQKAVKDDRNIMI